MFLVKRIGLIVVGLALVIIAIVLFFKKGKKSSPTVTATPADPFDTAVDAYSKISEDIDEMHNILSGIKNDFEENHARLNETVDMVSEASPVSSPKPVVLVEYSIGQDVVVCSGNPGDSSYNPQKMGKVISLKEMTIPYTRNFVYVQFDDGIIGECTRREECCNFPDSADLYCTRAFRDLCDAVTQFELPHALLLTLQADPSTPQATDPPLLVIGDKVLVQIGVPKKGNYKSPSVDAVVTDFGKKSGVYWVEFELEGTRYEGLVRFYENKKWICSSYDSI